MGIDTLRSYPTGKDSDVFGRRKKNDAAEDAAGETEQVVDSVDTEADEERERVRRTRTARRRTPRAGPAATG